eukprot:gene33136-40083_t
MVVTNTGGSLLINTLSKRSQYQHALGVCRQWAIGSVVAAIGVTLVSQEVYSKIVLWLLALGCIAYYVITLKKGPPSAEFSVSSPPLPNVQPQPTYSGQSSTTTPIKPNLNTSYASYASPEQRTTNLRLSEANRFVDEVLQKQKSPYADSLRRGAGGPPTNSTLFNTNPLTPPANITFGSPTLNPRNASQYQVSPVTSRSIYEFRHHGVEERDAGEDSTICDMTWSNSTIRVRDAVKALRLDQIKDEWTEELRLILGKHLLSVLEMFDDSVEELGQWLSAKIASMVVTTPLSAADVQLLVQLLGYNIDLSCRKVKLSNGSVFSSEELANLLKQLGVPQDLWFRYESASSLCKLCLHYVDMKNAASSTALYAFTMASSTSQVYDEEMYRAMVSQTGTKVNKNSLLGRLKEMLFSSLDNKLRVQWTHSSHHTGYRRAQSSSSSNATAVLLTDQEVAMAVFLHKCDALAAWKPAFSHLKFSQMHYALCGKDVHKISNQILQSSNSLLQMNTKNHSFKTATESADKWCICLYLNNHAIKSTADLAQSSIASGTSTTSAMYPHFDIYRGSLQHDRMRQLLHVESSRFDVFESMIVLLLTLFYTYQYTDEEMLSKFKLANRTGVQNGTGSSSMGIAVVDYAVVKELLRDIMGIDALEGLVDNVEDFFDEESFAKEEESPDLGNALLLQYGGGGTFERR